MNIQNERLVVLALIGALALNYPLLSIFSEGGLLFGIPILYLYLFVFWAGFIALAALIIEGRDRDKHARVHPDVTETNEQNVTR